MELKLKSLHLENFKCYSDSTFTFTDKTLISGQNAKGKTTILNAFLWCLTGKDADGKTDGSAIRPIGQPVEVIPSVSATLSIDGVDTIFNRQLQPTFSGRGVDKAYKGDSNVCSIDGVPKSVTEFQNYLSNIFPLDPSIWLDIFFFNDDAKLKPEDRRKILIDAFGNIDDETVKALNPQFEELFTAKGNLSVDDYKLALKETEKSCTAELGRGKTVGALQARIDEAMRTIVHPELSVATEETLISGIEEMIKKASVNSNSAIQKELDEAIAKQSELRLQMSVYATNKVNELLKENTEKVASISATCTELKNKIAELNRAIAVGESLNGSDNTRIEELKKELTALEISEPDITTVCPTCGQPIPLDKIAEAQEEYNEKKAVKMDELEKNINILTEAVVASTSTIANNKVLRDNLSEQYSNTIAVLQEIEAEREDIRNGATIGIPQDMADEAKAIQEKIDALKGKLTETDASDRIAELTEQLKAEQKNLAEAQSNERQKQRIAELVARQKEVAEMLSNAQKMLALADEFIVTKARFIEQTISAHFDGITFSLFDIYKNGELKNSCRLIMQDKPYRLLSFSQKTLASVSVIKGLAEHYNFYAPMFIDNASEMDSVSLAKLDNKNQTIIIKVSDDDFSVKDIL